ncbi:MAG TPA: hypothetical protein VJS40_03520 [Aestuariivirgaceae bacterium]|nr:hypothetical protein [Aestuariivirgaceae bacterium]
MNENVRPPEFAGRDYDEVEAAVMETECGRWFLSEFRRRNVGADTRTVLLAVRNLEKRIKALQVSGPAAGPRTSAATGSRPASGVKATRPAENRISSPAVSGKVVLEKVFTGAAKAPTRLSAENLKYFAKDEVLFAPLPAPAPVRPLPPSQDPNAPLPPFLIRKLEGTTAAKPATIRGSQTADIVKRRIVVRTAKAAPSIPLADELGVPARQAG